jgi:S1-C subfamily serine protease
MFRAVLNRRFLLQFLLLFGCFHLAIAADPERSVIQIVAFMQQPLWDTPWRFDSVRGAGGSGFVIKGKRIMTNAHVVSWARQIQVRRYQDPKPYNAEIEYIGHDCDLAVLRVDDSSFFDKLEPLDFGELPKVRTPVITYGYPAGGEEISYTRGVVSRIELEPYAHIGNRSLLSVQTDAAINPGNSGGPVIQDDRVVGVAFQGQPGLENTGFFIPPTVINHFLKDIEDGHYDGFPQAGARVVPLQNPAYRAFLKLPENNVGARVDSLLPIATTQELLKPNDVLLSVGDFRIASDATILYQGNRLSAALAFQFTQDGDSVPLHIWREGREIELSLPVHFYAADRAGGYQYLAPPKYYIYGGLVFTPLSLDYLKALGRGSTESNSELFYELYYHLAEDPKTARPEPIVIATVLADAVNANMSIRARSLVNKINGVRIEKMEDAIRAFESNTNKYDYIEYMPHNNVECLEHAEVSAARARIMRTYGLASDRRL